MKTVAAKEAELCLKVPFMLKATAEGQAAISVLPVPFPICQVLGPIIHRAVGLQGRD